jgi:hypothetical protein
MSYGLTAFLIQERHALIFGSKNEKLRAGRRATGVDDHRVLRLSVGAWHGGLAHAFAA